MTELKPCPFCGNTACVDGWADKIYVKCCECGAMTRPITRDLFVDGFAVIANLWNRRATNAK